MTELIQKVLVIPMGSADSERSFSLVKIIRGTARNSLQPDVVDHILRIRMNGLPMHMFNAEKYTTSYLSNPSNYRCDNPAANNPRAKKLLVEDDLEDVDEVTKEFHERYLLSGRSMIFL